MRIAFLGLGIMGSRMAANLVRAGHDVTAWTRTSEKADAWAAEHGAAAAPTASAAAAEAEVVVSIVVDGPQVHDIARELASAPGDGRLLVDMSTIGPAAAREAADILAPAGWRFLDAPVTGSSPKAEDGTLTIMTGGDAADHARALPLLEAMGELIVHAGPTGHGQLVKVINNAVAAANAATLGQALLVASGAGADLDALLAVMGAGSGSSAMLHLKSGAMRSRDWTTLFKLEHMLKDVRLCLEEAGAAGVPFPAAADVREALTAAAARGLGEADFAAVLEAYEGLAGRRL